MKHRILFCIYLTLSLIIFFLLMYLGRVYYSGDVGIYRGMINILHDILANTASTMVFLDINFLGLIILIWIYFDSKELNLNSRILYVVLVIITVFFSAATGCGLYLALREWRFMQMDKSIKNPLVIQ